MTSKRMKQIETSVDVQKVYSVKDALNMLKEHSTVKFIESLDVAIQTGVDPRKFSVRGVSVLPHGIGRSVRVAVFAAGDMAVEAKEAGAHVVGMDDLMLSMEKGDLDYGVVIATPEAMSIVGKLGKVLGPKGLMPNPKTGTVTADVKTAVKNALNGQVAFRLDKAGIVHGSVGRINFETTNLIDNLAKLLIDVRKAKPSAAKGQYIKKLVLSTTMGPGFAVDISTIHTEE